MNIIFPGSFDPITKGHEDIIKRALKIFGNIEILILNNFNKNHIFSINERKDIILKIFKEDKRVKITTFDGLLADYIKENDVDVILRSVRNVIDFENEKINAIVNNDLCDIETFFLFSKKKYEYVSSGMVKDVYFNGGNISLYVSFEVLEFLNNKFRRNSNGNFRIN